jgi:drug/metabolite transporter (DMT)-like permease
MKNNTGLLLLLALASAFFFSSTFIINRIMADAGGHWFWSASLRYVYTIIILFIGLSLLRGMDYINTLMAEFIGNLRFWLITGSLGFGAFYALICYAADHSPAWIVAATWQLTIIASLIVLSLFGQKISRQTWLLTLAILIGISLVNLSQYQQTNLSSLLSSFAVVLLAAFCYPLGNQCVWEASKGNCLFPNLSPLITEDSFAKVLLMSLGSLPIWFALYFSLDISPPSAGQLVNTAFVAVFSGIIATCLFLYARNLADTPTKLAMVDGSQSAEVIFALGAESLLLGAVLPNAIGIAGIVVTLVGLFALTRTD